MLCYRTADGRPQAANGRLEFAFYHKRDLKSLQLQNLKKKPTRKFKALGYLIKSLSHYFGVLCVFGMLSVLQNLIHKYIAFSWHAIPVIEGNPSLFDKFPVPHLL